MAVILESGCHTIMHLRASGRQVDSDRWYWSSRLYSIQPTLSAIPHECNKVYSWLTVFCVHSVWPLMIKFGTATHLQKKAVEHGPTIKVSAAKFLAPDMHKNGMTQSKQ